MESMMIYMPIAMAIVGLFYTAIKRNWVMKQEAGDGKTIKINLLNDYETGVDDGGNK